jgi:hypothetical protein
MSKFNQCFKTKKTTIKKTNKKLEFYSLEMVSINLFLILLTEGVGKTSIIVTLISDNFPK